ncbi:MULTISPECIES: nuclear transport factor 2 family protein [unclassified Streptomyces]|uniref:nuclear transport factor 2 family protein n=1 Tax=unclassified Streptomyces TaxID=2593676 RepID=UPI00225B73E4|nr:MULTISPECIES: nuclear transport factor 2 family protein [unclassified Streptomyces]MCX5060752.1 nuclear transport factor 2 family protein [Streptomyces sp. NBC_00452]MCX5293623.1 nuclear transport factor 2 family protein [Streptomyces sp. NBC_00183]
MAGEGAPAAQEALLRRMYEVFSTDERDTFVLRCLAPDVDWPNVLDGVRLHGREEVRAYWTRQFAAGHPLVRLEGVRLDGDGVGVVATVRTGMWEDASGDRWAEGTVEHVYRFGGDGLVTRMDVRAGAQEP